MGIRLLAAGKALLLCLVLVAQGAAQSNWQKEWEQTLAAAKKEGQINVYIYRYEGLLQDFKREYPGINVVSVTGRGTELTNRIMAERRAGKFIADVYSGGTNSLFNTLYKGKALDPTVLETFIRMLPDLTQQVQDLEDTPRRLTVSPARLVKFTNRRRDCAKSGASARPSSPRSPPVLTSLRRSRNGSLSRMRLRTTRISPPTSTTSRMERSVGSATTATGLRRPVTIVWPRIWAAQGTALVITSTVARVRADKGMLQNISSATPSPCRLADPARS